MELMNNPYSYIRKYIKYNQIDILNRQINIYYGFLPPYMIAKLYVANFSFKIKKCFENKHYIAKYIYYYAKIDINMCEKFINLIGRLMCPDKYIANVSFYNDNAGNEYLLMLLDYVINYFKRKKSKLYLQIKKYITDLYMWHFINSGKKNIDNKNIIIDICIIIANSKSMV